MGNHTIDCEFCGTDRRSISSVYCCDEYRKKEEAEKAAHRKRAQDARAILDKYGCKARFLYDYIDIDVADFLRQLIASGDLKER